MEPLIFYAQLRKLSACCYCCHFCACDLEIIVAFFSQPYSNPCLPVSSTNSMVTQCPHVYSYQLSLPLLKCCVVCRGCSNTLCSWCGLGSSIFCPVFGAPTSNVYARTYHCDCESVVREVCKKQNQEERFKMSSEHSRQPQPRHPFCINPACRRRVEKLRQQVDAAARTLQPLVRGLLARRLARREKALLGQASHADADNDVDGSRRIIRIRRAPMSFRANLLVLVRQPIGGNIPCATTFPLTYPHAFQKSSQTTPKQSKPKQSKPKQTKTRPNRNKTKTRLQTTTRLESSL